MHCCLHVLRAAHHSYVVWRCAQLPARAAHHSYAAAVQAFINTARNIYTKIQEGVFDVQNEVRGDVLQGQHTAVHGSTWAVHGRRTRQYMALMPAPHPALQSYGIKVGYGGGPGNAQAVKPGEGDGKKASSCC